MKTDFIDIEKNGNLRTTAQSHEIRKDLQTELQFHARQSYYLWAEQKAHESRFANEKDKTIWREHSQGCSLREIAPKVELDYSWLSRKMKKIEKYIQNQDNGSGSSQLDIFFWATPWNYV